MKNIISFFFLISFIGIVYGFTNLDSQDDDPAGKQIFVDSKCVSCHSIEAVGLTTKSKKKNIPDLSDVGTRHNADFIMKFVTKQETLNDAQHPMAFKGSDEELLTLAKWLESLKVSEEEKKVE
ncbi:MAG: hypothetical protein A2057_11830 [Ignavibacteria bacterium GWA2_35_9]|nr:MAG: hypothetical protein A2057_11830 [Ignavibacteria bacterium GWA2_35_9]OGU45349.1 MAG: hypothetical protein A2000_15055 [Ignavibacteria bacterium GWB2_36_8]OGU48039.1 MAG: hypothetical protein A2080_07545 [Ignavibacteria bacterium GWC2_36_12]